MLRQAPVPHPPPHPHPRGCQLAGSPSPSMAASARGTAAAPLPHRLPVAPRRRAPLPSETPSLSNLRFEIRRKAEAWSLALRDEGEARPTWTKRCRTGSPRPTARRGPAWRTAPRRRKNIDLDIPRHQLVVITGLSGSGKSSLAFDTLYAEGQRRYVESLSAYARQFLQLMDKPDVDVIEGLSPAISIEQKATSHNPRSTVGTVTEIHDYLRLLYARAGTPFCPDHPAAAKRRASARWSTPCWRCPKARG